MSAIVMDGKALAAKVKARALAASGELARKPGLAVILVGENPASQVYVRGKVKDCADCGIACFDFYLSADTTEDELLALVAELNGRDDVDGILCQLPLPAHITEKKVPTLVVVNNGEVKKYVNASDIKGYVQGLR